jgi:hypothetical protein
LHCHKQDYKRFLEKKSKKFYTAFKVIDGGNFEIILVEEYPSDNKAQLEQRERFYIENNECVNKMIPTRTDKEYYSKNAEKIKEYSRKRYRENSENIREKGREYDRLRRDNRREYKREYDRENKDKINEQRRKRRYEKKLAVDQPSPL